MTQTMTSLDFNRDVAGARSKAEQGPVIVTDQGKPAFVLLRYQDFQRISAGGRSIAEALADPETDDIDFDPPRLSLTLKPAELDD